MVLLKTVFYDLAHSLIKLKPNKLGLVMTIVTLLGALTYAYLFKEEKVIVKKIIYAFWLVLFIFFLIIFIKMWLNV